MTPITKKQYVISSKELALEGVTEYQLFGRYLYVGDGLKVTQCEAADGKTLLLLGHAYCMDRAGKSVEEDMAAFCGDDLVALTQHWTGRFVLMTETTLMTDATGLMSAFYRCDEDGYCVSSSLALIADVLGLSSERSVPKTGLTWQLLPRTLIPTVKALLCTQQIIFKEKSISVEPAMWMNDRRSFSTEEKCSKVANLLTNGVRNIAQYAERDLVLALTGGKDSRLTMAALLRAKVPFSAYTAEHDTISGSDKTVPPQLCRMFDVPHRVIGKGKTDAARVADYRLFTAQNANGADAIFYARGQYEPLSEALVLRSGLYEAGQTFGRSIAGGTEGTFAEGMRTYYSEIGANDEQDHALDEWLATVRDNPDGFADIRDRFYVEQRVGGWVAAIEQSMDMNEFLSIQIANCAELLSILLSSNEEERRSLALSYETTRLLEPRVLEIPVNQKGLRDRVSRIVSIVKSPVKKLKNYCHKKCH